MSEWIEYHLDELYTFGSGLSKPSSEFGFGYPFLTFKVVFNNYFLPRELTDLVNSTEKERQTCSIQRGDVFLTRTSETAEELGMSSVALKDYPEATFNGFTKRLRPKDATTVFPEFIGYYLRNNKIRAIMSMMSSETTRASLSNSMMASISVLLPPHPTQRAIAEILSSLDDKIDLLTRQNATLEALAQTYYRQWFVEEDCELGRLDNIAKITMGQSPSGTSYNEDGIGTMFFQGRGEFGWRYPTVRLFTTEPQRMAKRGDILMSVRAPVGDINIAESDCCVGRGLAAINSKYQTFVLYALKEQSEQLKVFDSEGTVFGSITKDGLNGLQIHLPLEAKISEFNDNFSVLDLKIERNSAQILTLQKLRDTLLPKLISGEVKTHAKTL